MTQGTFREALAVGCDLYDEDCYPNLKGAIRDAIKVHGFFSHAMPAGSRFDRVELMQNPTADQVVQRLREVQRRLGVGSLFVFYFAGHGIYRGNDNYLLCSNALESLSRPDGRGEFGAIPVSFMEDFYRRCQADIVSIYDACRSFVRKSARGAGESGDFGGATGFRNATDARPEAVGDVGARWTLMSCREGQKASDDGRFVDAWLGSMRARLDSGLELRLNDALVDDVYTKLGRGEQQPEPKGLGYLLAPGRPANAQTQGSSGVNEALLRRLEELEKRLAEREKPTPQTPPQAPKSQPQTPIPTKVETRTTKAGVPQELMIKGVKVVFRYCPAGTFMMGSPTSEKDRFDDEVQHEVRLTKGYWLLETEVTQALWKAVMDKNPSHFPGNDLPVETVSWNYCSDFVSKLNDGGYAPKGMKFDFPTEAEWEYACRAGSKTRYSFGNEITKANANYGHLFVGKTTPVKKYAPNAWNLYDMHGNVWEWVYDWYGDYPIGTVTDPTGSTSGSSRVLRGGSWLSSAKYCRSADRHFDVPSGRGNSYGFRLALRSAE